MFCSFSHKTAHTPRRARVCACRGWRRGREGGARCERGDGRGGCKARRCGGAVSGTLTGSVGAATNGLWRRAQAGCALPGVRGVGQGAREQECVVARCGVVRGWGRCMSCVRGTRCVVCRQGRHESGRARCAGKGRGVSTRAVEGCGGRARCAGAGARCRALRRSARVVTVHVGCGARSSFCANGNLHGALRRKRGFCGHDVEFWGQNSKLLFLGSALRGACWKTTLGFGLIDDSRWFARANSLVSGRHRWRPETSFYVSAGRRQY